MQIAASHFTEISHNRQWQPTHRHGTVCV